ncbi:MAG: hypothetical protein WKF59_06990 [Chitinophagaceae bacterium]
MIIILTANILEFLGFIFFNIDTKNLLRFDNFGLHFNTVALFCTLIYFLLNGRDIEKVGKHVSEYFALIFFVLCGVAIASSFKYFIDAVSGHRDNVNTIIHTHRQ